MGNLNSFDQARKMYQILKRKGEISLEDIILQFEVSPSTAYNIQRVLKALCLQRAEECEVQTKDRKTVFIYRGADSTYGNDDKVTKEILNAKPIRHE